MYLQFSEPNSIICFVCSHLFFNSDCLLVQNSQMLKEEDDCQLVIRLLLPITFTQAHTVSKVAWQNSFRKTGKKTSVIDSTFKHI